MTRRTTDELLDLTVHSLPKPALDSQKVGQATGRWKLLALVLAFSLPIWVAYFVLYVVKPQGQASFGQLIQPVQPMPDGATVHDVQRKSELLLDALKGQWLLVKVDSGACAASCQSGLVLTRQLRLMLGQNMDRIDWVWLIDDDQIPEDGLLFNVKRDKAWTIRTTADVAAAWLPAQGAGQRHQRVYVVDPMGNAMMFFPLPLDRSTAARAKHDLEHLLRSSAAWDRPGR
ncbi:MAG: cytochrome c oxidase subunit I [Rhodoferax sp.]